MTKYGFDVVVHPGAEPWAPDESVLRTMRMYFPLPDATVHLWPRHRVQEVSGRQVGRYDFRAFTRGNESNVFVDDTETRASVPWIMSHELAHQLLRTKPELHRKLRDGTPARVRELDRAGDLFHRVDPEEVYCDDVANRIVGKEYDRDWWRSRVQAARTG
jgi:hypothetical protein